MSGGYNYYLGLFDSEREAAVAYTRAHRKLFGDAAAKKTAAKNKRKRAAVAPSALEQPQLPPAQVPPPSEVPQQPVPGLGTAAVSGSSADGADGPVTNAGAVASGNSEGLSEDTLPSLVSRLTNFSGEDPSALRNTAELLRKAAAEAESRASSMDSKGSGSDHHADGDDGQVESDSIARQRSMSFADSVLPRVDESGPNMSSKGEAGIVRISSSGEADIPPPVQYPLPRVGGLQVPAAPPNSAISAGTGPPRLQDDNEDDTLGPMPSSAPSLLHRGGSLEMSSSRDWVPAALTAGHSKSENSLLSSPSPGPIDHSSVPDENPETLQRKSSLGAMQSFDDEDIAAAALAAASEAD